MPEAEKKVTLWCLQSEIEIFERSLKERLPSDANDVRVQHLTLLRLAKRTVSKL